METNKNTAPERQLLSVEIKDVETGEILKEGITRGISCVFTTEKATQNACFFTGIDTVEAVEIILSLQKLANEIEKNLKENSSEETVEEIKRLIKENNPDYSGKEIIIDEVREDPEMTFSGNMESKEGE